ncbi:hypothetical protein [Oceanirhabdus seepicola]|uniref:Uncharacterized protein n=1 Tax=Oceanirhabdus seepicola TaxID=2828781 RepID=A0A9J6P7Q6_9CLOT|nr:hypothetical protein [Oceanirhabdus seepicola]MCM1991560.1 hypothetical protein [Oceanirhabdus seepicola]
MSKKNIVIIILVLCLIFFSILLIIRYSKDNSHEVKEVKNSNYLDEKTKAEIAKKYGLNAPTSDKSSKTTYSIGFSFDNSSKKTDQTKDVTSPKKIELLSYKGILVDDNEVFLDETNSTIKNSLEETPNVIEHSYSTSIQYSYKYFDVFFDEDDKCMEIQIINYPEIGIYYDGHNLMDFESYQAIETFFKEYDDNLTYDSTGFTSEKLGINVYCEHLNESPLNPVDAFLIFNKK